MTDAEPAPETPSKTAAPPPVGLLGLGLMGRPVAARLAAAGRDVLAWNRRDVGLTEDETDPPGGGTLRTVDAVGDLARCEVVLSLLPDLAPLEERLEHLLGPGSRLRVLVVMSTVSPTAVRATGERLAERGVGVVDAPMSGGTAGAREGRLAIMLGGSDADVARVRPLLEPVASRIEHLGPLGAGSLTKACNQMVVSATTIALAEAALIAQRQGLDRAQVFDVLSGGLAASEVLDQKRRALEEDDFTVTGPAKYLVKDLGFARDAAGEAADALPVLAASERTWAAVVETGRGDEDTTVVLDVLRDRAR
ncbi:NAD(P)-dependent oxidoreductase [Agilicoccus flavus]|uniref:NAD(P)-dependent oxidoreductase n=1 Tax=Agilicoccus flavus TaxID=2775968 RepID=UPI001CF71932|nr:NAD(P)-dependent oxidoreductase [Agilicoccus flavus]